MSRSLAQQRMTLSDLEWPFHESRAIAAVAELFVYYCFMSICVFVLLLLYGLLFFLLSCICVLIFSDRRITKCSCDDEDDDDDDDDELEASPLNK